MFNNILAATARPLECDESVLSAGRIAKHDNAKLLILHVLESESTIYRNYVKHYRTGEEIVGDKGYQEKVKEEIIKNCRSDLGTQQNLEIHIATGFPWMEIVKKAREESVDLIVLGAHMRKPDSREKVGHGAKIGSTADGVIRHERCPVMIVGKPIPDSRVAFKKVMVSIDFSPSCMSAFQFAKDLAQKRGSKSCLFHMLPTPPQPQYSQTRYETDIRAIRRRLNQEFLSQIISLMTSRNRGSSSTISMVSLRPMIGFLLTFVHVVTFIISQNMDEVNQVNRVFMQWRYGMLEHQADTSGYGDLTWFLGIWNLSGRTLLLIRRSDCHLYDVIRFESSELYTRDARSFFYNTLSAQWEPILILDESFHVFTANRAFLRTFKTTPGETEHRFIFELGDNQWDIPGLRKFLVEVIPHDSEFEGYEVEHDFPGIGHRKMSLNARKIEQGEERPAMILLGFRDITGT